MKQKVFQIIVIFIFFVGFWYFYGDEFWDYQDTQQQEKIYQESISEKKESFDMQNISTLEDTQLFVTPDLWLLDDIVSQIDNAQERVYLEAYIFTERDMRDAIIRAHSRGVEVKVLLENNPYKAPYLNDSHYNDLDSAGVNVAWSDPLNYSLNHAKMLIIDDTVYVSTGNFSYSLFKHNRDFLIKIHDSEFLEILEALFLWDFWHKNIGIYHENLVLSPDYSRSKLTNLVRWAQKSIDFYFPYLADEDFQNVLFELAASGIKIRWIVDTTFYKENPELIELYISNWINLRKINSWKLHAKSIMVDDRIAYVGSINFSTYSFDENREIGVILQEQNVVTTLLEVFNSDL